MKDDYTISDDKNRVDLSYVHRFLTQSYWAKGIPVDVVQRSINTYFCFAVFYKIQQVGFARVITDDATFAYLGDVCIDEILKEEA